jgi:hypothetical protein
MKKIFIIILLLLSSTYAEYGDSISPNVFLSQNMQVISDKNTNLMWPYHVDSSQEDRKNWEEAVNYCNNLELGEHDDWRLPNVYELYSTCDVDRAFPSTGILINIGDNRWSYWTSTSSAYIPDNNAWYIDFSDALVRYASKTSSHSAICVRDINLEKTRTISAGADQNIHVGNSVTLTGVAEDKSDILCILWKEGNQVLSEDLNFTKSDFALGEHHITLTVCYNNDKNATDDVVVNIQNQAPVTRDINISTRYNAGLGIDITLLGSDADGDPLTYEILTQPIDGSLDPLNGNVVTYYPVSAPNIPSTFTYKVNDGITDSNIATVTITITSNHAPIAQDQTITMSEDDPAINIQLQATDADGDSLTYTLVQGSSGKIGNSFTLANTATTGLIGFSLNQDKSGTEILKFKASDGQMDSNIATVTINVAPVDDLLVNDPPNVSLGQDRQINEGENITINADASDIDGRVVMYIWRVDDVVVQNNNTSVLTLNSLAIGRHKVSLTVTDNEVLSSEDTIYVTVSR